MDAISRNPLYVRVDASAEIGIGHFMRCLALAQYWRDHAGAVTFAGSAPVALSHRLAAEGIDYLDIAHSHPDPRDLTLLQALLPDQALLVIDGYQFDAAYCAALAQRCRVLVIDDYGHRSAYAGDILLNQNTSAAAVAYGETPVQRLLGARYALLGRDFRTLSPSPRTSGPIRHVLVTFGGADRDNVTQNALEALKVSELVEVTTRVVVGPANPNHTQLAAFAEENTNVHLVSGDFDMSALMADSDLAISAAGSTSLELAYLGVPMVLVPIADNQVAIAASFADAGAALVVDKDAVTLDEGLVDAIASLASQPELMASLSDQARGLVDGDGVVRVAAALCQLVEK